MGQSKRLVPGGLRRYLFALAAAAALTAGMTGVAGATTAPTGAISATSAPSIPSSGTSAAGSLTVTLGASGSLDTGKTLQLKASPSAGSGVVTWSTYTVSTSGITHSTVHALGSKLDIVLGAKVAGATATIQVTGISYSTTSGEGTVLVGASITGVVFTPSSASDAKFETTSPHSSTPPSTRSHPTPPTFVLEASSEPHLGVGETGGEAGAWTLTMSGTSSSGNGWTSGDVAAITVAPPSGSNCAGNGYLFFSGTPSVVVSSAAGVSAIPTVSAALASSGTCGSVEPNVLEIELTNSGTFDTGSTGDVTIAISGVRYTVGSTASSVGTGAVNVSLAFPRTSSPVSESEAANAIVGGLSVLADTPPVTVPPDAYDAPISPISVVAYAPLHLTAGYVCLTLAGSAFDASSHPAVKVTAGDPAVDGNAEFQGTGATGAAVVQVDVTAPSTAAAGFNVSGLRADARSTSGPVMVSATYGSSATCTSDTTQIGSATAFTVAKKTEVAQIYGATPDATAAAELEHQFDATGTACPGRAGARPVVLATDARYPDALASAYLASFLQTGELLTPTTALSSVTANAIREEGITNVYVVGGPLAVSEAVVKELQTTLAYNCGGASPITSAHPVYLQVTRIYGQTQYDTAQWVAEYPTATGVGTLDVAGAYAGADRTGGTGRYNDTPGSASSAPATSATLPTAIVATGTTFQDAESAGALSYADHLPILLTTPSSLSPEVSAAISDLQIKQVIVMGGQLAVSDDVVTALEDLGVSVLRIAGQNYTDTAVQLAEFEMASSAAHVGLGWQGTGRVAVARGNFYTDGLAGAIVAAGMAHTHSLAPEPLLLTVDPTTVGQYLTGFLEEAGKAGIDGNPSDTVSGLTILGGPDAVSPDVIDAMTSDL
jgi:putative cell wall-binding protein